MGGRLDTLVASAGITGPNGAVKGYPEGKRLAQSLRCQPQWRLLLQSRGRPRGEEGRLRRIVNVASVAEKEGNPNASAYSASKAAVIALTKSLGNETATSGIRKSTASRRRHQDAAVRPNDGPAHRVHAFEDSARAVRRDQRGDIVPGWAQISRSGGVLRVH